MWPAAQWLVTWAAREQQGIASFWHTSPLFWQMQHVEGLPECLQKRQEAIGKAITALGQMLGRGKL